MECINEEDLEEWYARDEDPTGKGLTSNSNVYYGNPQ